MKRALTSALLAFALLTAAAPAWAADPGTAAPTPPRVRAATIDVQLWTEDVGNRTTLVVVGTIPTATPLPAVIALPLPKNAKVTWAGEIFEDAAQDKDQTPTVAPDGLSLTLIATTSRLVQYEAEYAPYTDRGGRRYAKLEWVQSVPAGAEEFAVKLPFTSSDPRMRPANTGRPAVNDKGEKLYLLPGQKLETGESLTISVDYVPALPQTASRKTALDYVLPVAAGLLAVVLVALVLLAARNRRDRDAEDEQDG